ncbi:MAG: VWA domain-containing protein [Cytophagales bacterium]|nr:VWA domain-containing protein [Cytophagales bacterium]MDW8385139.1 VWA domain-containing protein [Flammeovirgaceae bacterium]
MTTFTTQYSIWWILLALALGVAYAWLLYGKESNTWSLRLNRFLAFVRGSIVTIIAVLLIGFFLKNVSINYEKPIFAIGIDDSRSIASVYDSMRLQNLKEKIHRWNVFLKENGFDVRLYTLQRPLHEDSLMQLRFQVPTTDLYQLLKTMQSDMENRHLAGLLLISDGIFNQGIAPDYWISTVPIYTIGLGDTVPKNDLQIKSVYANKITYLGNRFPIVAELMNSGFSGKTVTVFLKKEQQILDKQEIFFSKNQDIKTVEFNIEATEKGVHGYSIEIQGLPGEFSKQNNQRSIYVEVLDSKQKILIVASAPHPDIKAIRSALEKNQNYEILLYLPFGTETQSTKINFEDKYSLVIFYQVPHFRNLAYDVWQKLKDKPFPKWYILGNQSHLSLFLSLNEVLKIVANPFQKDRATPVFNDQFDKFFYDTELRATLQRFPPLSVPFGEYQTFPNSIVLLYQRIGSVNTEKPLFVIGEKNQMKIGVLVGEGIWQWRLHNFQIKQNHEAFDQLILKIVQYLSTQEDKRKFRMNTTNSEYIVGEDVVFETEIYNDIYEPVVGKKVELVISSSQNSVSYNFVNSTPNFKFPVKGLPQGIYRYKASVLLKNELEEVVGKFIVKDLQTETSQITAQWALLRNLALQSGGEFAPWQSAEKLIQKIIQNKIPDRLHTEERLIDILQWTPILGLLVALLTVEWTIRKLKGKY